MKNVEIAAIKAAVTLETPAIQGAKKKKSHPTSTPFKTPSNNHPTSGLKKLSRMNSPCPMRCRSGAP